MAGKKSTFASMTLTLFFVTFLSAIILGFVQEITKEPIRLSKINEQNVAISAILPPFKELSEPWYAKTGDSDSVEVFNAYDSDRKKVGMAINTYSKNGFGGLIRIIVGFNAEGVITGYRVLEHKETPGLGSKMAEWFMDSTRVEQCVVGRNPEESNLTVRKDGGDIDAISASTITSRAFLEALRRAHSAVTGSADGVSGASQ
ncbi:MAG: RnfABCDGE type electron transport complex subunit G [Bacteroidales bacterium]|jgi:electron transport complex protein RnfG|nr:RnfABCDGE type electron transport complex subunit G [Bacteroidales bacterium]